MFVCVLSEGLYPLMYQRFWSVFSTTDYVEAVSEDILLSTSTGSPQDIEGLGRGEDRGEMASPREAKSTMEHQREVVHFVQWYMRELVMYHSLTASERV